MCSVNKYAYIIFKIKFLSFSALCNDYIFNTEKMKTKYREQFTLSINFYNIRVNLLLFIFFKSTHLSIMKLSKLITMKYDVTKSICIPSGTGSGMVIPVSSVCCWKTEGLWGFFPFYFSPLSLSVIQSFPGTQVTHALQWAKSFGDMTPLGSSKRDAPRVRPC